MTLVNRLTQTCVTAEDATPDEIFAAARAGGPLTPGQYAHAWKSGDEIRLVRDPLGLAKLFYAAHPGHVIATSRIDVALAAGVPLDSLASVPAGHAVSIREGRVSDPAGEDVSSAGEDPAFDIGAFQRHVRQELEHYLDRLPRRFPGATFVVCLSGGLDSTAIAALAVDRLPTVAAVCFSYLSRDGFRCWLQGAPDAELPASDDFRTATTVAQTLGLRMIPVLRPPEAVAAALPAAVRLCQDWRDFNVHCAVVNLFLAEGVRTAFPAGDVVLLTGDLMNELICDYREEVIEATVYYPQPRVGLAQRRRFFVRGLDAGDREIGVFNAFGIPVVQPFAAVARDYMRVPASLLERPDAKLALNGPLLPRSVRDGASRIKRRAQVGGTDGGTLGLVHALGIGQQDLFRLWTDALPAELRGTQPEDLIQCGRYRTTTRVA
jgi:asparagine synthetase B (glutamine-hydrolysing)